MTTHARGPGSIGAGYRNKGDVTLFAGSILCPRTLPSIQLRDERARRPLGVSSGS